MNSKRTLAWLVLTLLAGTVAFAQTSGLDARTEEALLRALDDERHAQAVYRAVLDRHGEVRPFTNILRAEERHESRLIRLFEAYGVEVPADPWPDQAVEVPDTLDEACALGARAEQANLEMYDEFLEFVEQADIRRVFTKLRTASEENHLPALERCCGGEPGRGRGRGRGTR